MAVNVLIYNFVELVSKNTALNIYHSLKHFYHNTAEHIMIYFYWLIPQNCNFSKARHRLHDDGPDEAKNVGALMRYFNYTF